MAYRVEVTTRAQRDLGQIYAYVHAADSEQAHAWFDRLEAVVCSLDENPSRGAVTPEDKRLRHLLYGDKSHVYRIIYRVRQRATRVEVLHIRGARDFFKPSKTR